MSRAEAAMMLFTSLKGEAEEELENYDLKKINCAEGIDNILTELRGALQTRAVYQKRKFLHEFEQLGRYGNEGIRSFCNRYARIERQLQAAGIEVGSMYDSEARGARLLDRMRLTSEQQRLILVATGQSLHYETVREAAQMQFPEHRPSPPAVYAKEFDAGRRAEPGQQSENRQGGKGYKGNSKGGKDGKGKPHKAYVTEKEDNHNEDEEHGERLPDIPARTRPRTRTTPRSTRMTTPS